MSHITATTIEGDRCQQAGGAPPAFINAEGETTVMKVLIRHIYEYRKGLRSLVMHTLPDRMSEEATAKLRRFGIEYHLQPCLPEKVNIYFGAPECVAVVRRITRGKKLHEMSPEEDFVLGSMLGYGIRNQCERYLRKAGAEPGPVSIHRCA